MPFVLHIISLASIKCHNNSVWTVTRSAIKNKKAVYFISVFSTFFCKLCVWREDCISYLRYSIRAVKWVAILYPVLEILVSVSFRRELFWLKSSWFSSVSPGTCQDNALNYLTICIFLVLSNYSAFILTVEGIVEEPKNKLHSKWGTETNRPCWRV
jgi:hypothetical protein